MVNIVCGPRRIKLGTHPLSIQKYPSFLVAVVIISMMLALPPPLMIRVLITSTGLHIVVATKPADRLEVKCV